MTGKGGAGSMGGGSKEFLTTMDNMALGGVRSSCALSSLDGERLGSRSILGRLTSFPV